MLEILIFRLATLTPARGRYIEDEINDMCVSGVAFINFLKKNWNNFSKTGQCGLTVEPTLTIPIEFKHQKKLINCLLNNVNIEKYWNKSLEIEDIYIKRMCSKSDTDFFFVLDASPSVTLKNWKNTLDGINKYWVDSLSAGVKEQYCSRTLFVIVRIFV